MFRLLSVFSLLLAAVSAVAQPSLDDVAGQGAGSLDAERMRPGLSREAILDVEAGSVGAHLDVDVALQLGYAHNPLVATMTTETGQSSRAIVAHRAGAHLLGSIALFERLQLGVDVPVVLFQSGASALPGLKGENPVAVAGLADVRLMPKVAVLRTRDGSPVDVAVIAHLTLPTALPRHQYIGDGLPTLTPEVAVSRDHGALRWAVDGGLKLRAPSTFGTATQGEELVARAGVGWDFEQIPLGVEASANGALLVFPIVGEAKPLSPGNNPVEGLVGAHTDVGDVQLFAAAGAGAGGIVAPLWRVLGGVRWSPRCNDDDGDGICAALDACTGAAEDQDDNADHDGCPDVDDDSDGLFDGEDACPRVAGPADSAGGAGCPAPPALEAPVAITPEPIAPVVVVDRDNDGFGDDVDVCIDVAGVDAGCPRAAPVRISLSGQVAFATGSSALTAPMQRALEQLVKDVKAAGRPVTVTIDGHTDDVGDAARNRALSQSRAEAVKQFLVELGLDGSAITATGHGAAQPIAGNDSAAGRQQNRRVDVVVSDAG